ncbi:MAG: hypothetical protein [Sanya fiers-like virus 23]|nr:MAG: hypothetical protein [Sanya fiers-like virus 23]
MPTMANITVKKNDGTTDQVYTVATASGGDKAPAVWRNNSVGTAVAHRPTFKCSARANGTGSARRVDTEMVWPYTVTGTDGKISVVDKAIFTGSFLLPNGMPLTEVNEAVAQAMNLLASALIKSAHQEGFAPA